MDCAASRINRSFSLGGFLGAVGGLAEVVRGRLGGAVVAAAVGSFVGVATAEWSRFTPDIIIVLFFPGIVVLIAVREWKVVSFCGYSCIKLRDQQKIVRMDRKSTGRGCDR